MMKIFQKNQTAAVNEHAVEDGCSNVSDRARVRMLGRTNWSAKYQFPSPYKLTDSIKKIQNHKAVINESCLGYYREAVLKASHRSLLLALGWVLILLWVIVWIIFLISFFFPFLISFFTFFIIVIVIVLNSFSSEV